MQQSKIREYGRANLQYIDRDCPLMRGVSDRSQVWMSHGDTIEAIPDNYRCICSTDNVKYAGFKIDGEDTYAIQFHPEKMIQSGFISYKVNPKDISAAATDYAELSTEDKKRFLMEILDKNLLYVNYCDIDDEEFGVLEADKTFTRSFYREG